MLSVLGLNFLGFGSLVSDLKVLGLRIAVLKVLGLGSQVSTLGSQLSGLRSCA